MRFDLDLLDETPPAAAVPPLTGRPMLVPIDLIDEDPDQPRQAFDDEALRELAASMAERGVLQPVSVRPHPTAEGRWRLNFGARRLRAARLAGFAEVPAFVNDSPGQYDQVVENEQREGLSPMELARFVQGRVALGESLAEIARRLGKSKSTITYATALIDAPAWLEGVYREGRCRGGRELWELRRLQAEAPDEAERLIASGETITRTAIESARQRVDAPAPSARADGRPERPIETSGQEPVTESGETPASDHPGPPSMPPRSSLRLMVDADGVEAELVTDHAPREAGTVYIRLANGVRISVAANHLKLIGFARQP